MGLYEDGNQGSPLITNDCIKQLVGELLLAGKKLKPINVVVNDKETGKVENVQKLLAGQEIAGCSYNYHNLEADAMLEIVSTQINNSETNERHLIFIDPYGYSSIDKRKIYNLLKKETSEIILFLPVNQMYRFSDKALSDFERTCYNNLRKFINSFFPENHRIHNIGVQSNIEYIHELKQALSFNNQFYSCSHYIERTKGVYYGLFFITSNIYGLEKMVEAKWEVDKIAGQGFPFRRNEQPGLFDSEFEEVDRRKHVDFLKEIIINYLRENEKITNVELYELSLKNEFKIPLVNTALKDLVKGKRLCIVDVNDNAYSAIAYYINYSHHKNKEVKTIFKLIK